MLYPKKPSIEDYIQEYPSQPPIFEQALKDVIDNLSMGGVSKETRFKLVSAILRDVHMTDEQFKRENHMRLAKNLPKLEPASYLPGISEVFYACYNIAIKSGNPGPKLLAISKIIEEAKLFPDFHPTDDYWASRRGEGKGLMVKIDIIDLDDLFPAGSAQPEPPVPIIETIEPKVTVVIETKPISDSPGLNIALPPKRKRDPEPAEPIGPADPAPEPYTPD